MKTRKNFIAMALIANLNRAALAASNQRFAVPLLIIALAFACIACEGEPEPETITKTITVPAITTVANPMNFGEVSSLTGWDADFPSSDVFYTVTVGSKTITSTSATTIDASGLSNGPNEITQTFYYKGNPITNGSRSGQIAVTSNTFGAWVTDKTFTSITLTLTKPK